jgi:type IV secretion system protein VirB4
MSALPRQAALQREIAAGDRIPYAAQVSEHVVKTVFGDYVQVFRLGGASFECADDDQLNTWHERLNVLWRNVASPQVALWAHVIRRREVIEVPQGAIGFSGALAQKYRTRLARQTLMVNELYLSTVYRPTAGLATGLASRLLRRAHNEGSSVELADALDACEKLRETVRASLLRHEPEALGIYSKDGRCCSGPLNLFSTLINGDVRDVPLSHAPLAQVLGTSRVSFGTEVLEYRQPTSARIGAMLGVKEYPTPTHVGLFDALLSAPFPFVLTQSFTFLTKAAGQALLQRQFNRMMNAGDFAVSQAEELKDALDALTSNEFVMGDHHFSLLVLADEPRESEVSGAGGRTHESEEVLTRQSRSLSDSVALARAMLGDTGMTVAREDLALEAAFWAQLPGNFPMRPRKAPITSRNFACLVPFHNYPAGRASGNHWGEALTVLVTSAHSPFHFSLHASDPTDPEGGSRKDTGHTLICGPTGSGKTVFIGFLVAQLTRQGATQILFDKDRGLEILVRALGGEYCALKNGEPTGFNPLKLPPTPLNVEFLKAWLRVLVRGPSGMLTVRQQADLDAALRGTLALELSARRLSRVQEFLDSTDSEGLHARLAPWCEAAGGDYAWVFDNPEDVVVPRLAGSAIVGFDVTDFLDHELCRTPVTLYLFHLVRHLLDGRRLVCWMDEFWRLLADPAFEGFAKEGPKTWRKLNGVMALATQSVSDVLVSPISRTLIEQTPTKVFFPNADANREDYCEGFGLTEREFRLIKDELEPGSRRFLVRQGHQSVVCELDLKGFDAELAVISGRRSAVDRVNQLVARAGPDPTRWLPDFYDWILGDQQVSAFLKELSHESQSLS